MVFTIAAYSFAFLGFSWAGCAFAKARLYWRATDKYYEATSEFRHGSYELGVNLKAEGDRLTVRADRFLRWLPGLGEPS